VNRLRRRLHIHEYAVIGLGRFGSSVALTLDSTTENALKEIGG
jgi:Trk K+ transport system NAD-binding subunit